MDINIDFSDVIEIPTELFIPDEYLDTYRTFQVSTLEEVEDALDTYQEIEEDVYDFEEQKFKILLIILINGRYRTLVYNQITISEFETKLIEFGNKVEKYNEEGEDLFGGFCQIKLKPINPWYGGGDYFHVTKILNNTFYHIIFTKTSTNCEIISAIKHEEPEYRTKPASDFIEHILYNHVNRYSQEYNRKRIEEYYNKKIVILSHYNDLVNYKSNHNYILLFAIGYHIGYVSFEYPIIKNNLNIKNTEKIRKNTELEKIYAFVVMDCEFSLKEISDNVFKSEPPNLIVLKCMLPNGKEKIVVKNSFKMVFNFLKMLSDKGPTHVFSVNGSRVEHQFILKTMIEDFGVGNKNGYYKLDNISSTKIKTLKYGKNLYFYDLYLLLPMSVKDMTNNFNTSVVKSHKDWANKKYMVKVWDNTNNTWIEKFDSGEWYKNHKWDHKNDDDIEYCLNDCEIPYQAALEYNRILRNLVKCKRFLLPNGEEWVLSNSSISSIGKQTIFNKYPYIFNTEIEKGVFQPLYLGGRCEMFYFGFIRSGKLIIIIIDVNSAYPHFATLTLPGRCIATVYELPNSGKWVAYVELKYTKKFRYPPLGILKDNEFIFPNINNYTLITLWDFEYELLKDYLDIRKIHIVYVFETIDLKDIISPWYEIKKNATTLAEKNTAKMLCNGSLGGLGLKHVQDKRSLVKNEEEYADKMNLTEYSFEDGFGGMKWVFFKEFIKSKTCYQTIGYITARQRLYLWDYFHNTVLKIDKNAQLLYCDTDSLHIYISKEGRDILKSMANNELGGWDFSEHEAAFYKGLKKYCVDDVVKFNGICNKNLEKMSMMHLLDSEIETFNEKWNVTRDLGTIIRKSRTNMRKEYSKGIIEDDMVIPLEI